MDPCSHPSRGSGNLQRSPIGLQTQGVKSIGKLTKPCYRIMADLLKKILDSDWPLFILCLAGLFSDSLFLFVAVISSDKKCIRLDESMGITACVLRTVIDFLFTICFISFLKLRKVSLKVAKKYFLTLIHVLSVLPLPQVLVAISIIRKMTSKTMLSLASWFLLIQLLPRLLQVFTTFQVRKLRGSIFLAKYWPLFIFIYIYSSQLYGACWYRKAIDTEIECWKKACESHSGCSHDSFFCHQISKDYKFRNDFCSRNTSKYDFGIYTDAHQSGILEMSGSPRKLLYLFRWTLQNLWFEH